METLVIRFVLSIFLSSLIAIRSLKRNSLDRSGAFAGFLVMAIHFFSGFRFGIILLVFFFSSSMLTKVGHERKRKLEEDFREGGQRNWVQVLSNSAIATILLIVLSLYREHNWCLDTKDSTLITGLIGGIIGHYACCNGDMYWVQVLSNSAIATILLIVLSLYREHNWCLDTKDSTLITGLIGGIIGHYACCNGDTWSSEIGILSDGEPRLITTFKKVRKGTNGGITVEGVLAAAAAGFVIGLSYVVVGLPSAECARDVSWRQLLIIPLATAAGLLGSLVDSFLGATLQYSGYCTVRKKVVSKRAPTVKRISGVDILDNNAVNAVSILLTTLLAGLACVYIF